MTITARAVTVTGAKNLTSDTPPAAVDRTPSVVAPRRYGGVTAGGEVEFAVTVGKDLVDRSETFRVGDEVSITIETRVRLVERNAR